MYHHYVKNTFFAINGIVFITKFQDKRGENFIQLTYQSGDVKTVNLGYDTNEADKHFRVICKKMKALVSKSSEHCQEDDAPVNGFFVKGA